jgi:hypothetical protein
LEFLWSLGFGALVSDFLPPRNSIRRDYFSSVLSRKCLSFRVPHSELRNGIYDIRRIRVSRKQFAEQKSFYETECMKTFPRKLVFSPFLWIAQLGLATVLCPSARAQSTITNLTGASVTVAAGGAYSVTFSSPAFTFSGNLAQPLTSLTTTSGADNIGPYAQITFGYTSSVGHSAGIRLYQNQPVVLFTDTTLASSPNDLAFPALTNNTPNLQHLAFGNTFGLYNFSSLFGDSPWLFFATNYDAFIFSPATNYMIVNNSQSGSGPLTAGINSAITTLPANFTHRTILVAQKGIDRTYQTWGSALVTLAGKTPPSNDAAIELNKLGYWTDNGATYYYNTNAPLGIENTLLSVRNEFASKGVPVAYVQLDSWWYPKGACQCWQGDPTNNRGGIYLYQPAAPLFPDGLSNFQYNLNLPLIVHARWIDSGSPYQTNYAISGGVCVDPAYWTNRMSFLKSCGVMTFEQDWLSYLGVPNMNLNDPPDFMNYMQAAAATNGLNLQYCMMWARHALQGSLYTNLMSIRTSQDRWATNRWTEFLYGAHFTSSLDEWPWTDVCMSSETRNLLLSALSGGPVGPGDALGAVNATNLAKVVRPDSIIVKPDTSLVPLDQTYVNDGWSLNGPFVAAAHSDHGALRALYVFAFARTGNTLATSFNPSQLGLTNDAYVYNYFTGAGTIVTQGNAFNFNTTLFDNNNGGTYYIAVPIGPSGIALLGDTNKFVTLGKKRISALTDTGFLRATVVYASGETNATLAGYAPSSPYVAALSGSVGTATYNPASHFFTVPVLPDSSAAATIALSLAPIPSLQITNLAGQVQISWPTNAQGFTLQQATTLAPQPDWTPATNTIVPVGNQNIVTLPATNAATFYRLKQ